MTRRLSSPRGLRVLAVPAIALVALPVVSVVWRTPWSDFWSSITNDSSRTALWLSLRTSLVTTALALVFGTPLAWLLAHARFRGQSLLRAVCILPMVLPPVIGGVALLFAFGRRGLVGGVLDDWFGIRLAFSETAAVMAQFFVAAPFFVVVMEAAFEQVDPRLVGTARTYGAGPWQALFRVTLPLVVPSLVAGLVLTWARALGEFGATITFAGNTSGRTQTVPLAVYSALESGGDSALALSMLMVLVSVAVLVALRGRWVGALRRSGA
ncbi:MAG: molybdate ABC transporter permease subunit [Actinobacteria bacterium]|jgi:molybdate transport system permease protein|nr:molybdate ABC transporter permease subunit [Actinomycetota bacterium]NBP54419.1 molybdate ABC transporter permease subunit [Actinomycetota bacterium]